MPPLVPVPFESKEPPAKTTVLVTAQDGQKFELQVAVIVLGVADQGMTNPLDGMPIFQIASQIVTRVTRHTDG
jgi:hypothetical protein